MNFAHYMEDTDYMRYLLPQLFNQWSLVKDEVANDLNNDLRYEIMLTCPYELLFEPYKQNQVFMKSWFEGNKNRKVTFDGIKVYHINEPAEDDTFICNYRKDNGVCNGPTIVFYNTATPHVYQKSNFVNGQFCGPYKLYSEAGLLSQEGEMYNDMEQGRFYIYDDTTGEIITECTFVNDVKEGPAVHYNEYDGKRLINCGSYHNDKQIGLWVLTNITTGKVLSETTFDQDGNIITSLNFDDND